MPLTEKAFYFWQVKEADLFKISRSDVLNIPYRTKVIFPPRPYNTIYTIKSELKDKSHKKYSNIINDSQFALIHYTGATNHGMPGKLSFSYFPL